MTLRAKLAASLATLACAQGVGAAMAAEGLIEIGSISKDVARLSVLAENARIQIKHDAAAETVRVMSNCPRHWNITGGTIRQVGLARPRSGVAMISDALGARAIVNGKVYSFPRGPIQNVSLTAQGVVVAGKKIEPMAGVNMAGDVPMNGFDELELVIPAKFSGDLMLGMNQDSNASIDSWSGGSIECLMTGAASLQASTSGASTIKMIGRFGDVSKTTQGAPNAIQIEEFAPSEKHI